jgi:hypothetical protein
MWLELYRKSPEVALWRALEGRFAADVVGSWMPVSRSFAPLISRCLLSGALEAAMEMLKSTAKSYLVPVYQSPQ